MRKTIGKAMAATTSLALALSMAACGSSSENAEEITPEILRKLVEGLR